MKVTKEKTNTAKRPKWVYILLAAAVILVVDLILFMALRSRQSEAEPPQTGSETASEVISAQEAQPEKPPAVAGETREEDISFSLDFGLEITAVGAYTGAYVEDGSNEVVSGVMMLTVHNGGEDAIQYGEIYLETDAGEAKFSLTTLLPGDTAVLLEQNRMAHENGTISSARTENVALFAEKPSLCEDKIEIGVLDGAINVKNISGEAIDGDVVIYYKNYSEGLYYGGITYRVRLEGGMEAEEIRQLMTEHFSAEGSRVVFVTCG